MSQYLPIYLLCWSQGLDNSRQEVEVPVLDAIAIVTSAPLDDMASWFVSQACVKHGKTEELFADFGELGTWTTNRI